MNEFRDTDIGYVSRMRSVDAERANVVHLHRATVIGCTGNCDQGRACDCVADVEGGEEDEFDVFRGLIVAIGITVGAAAVAMLGAAVWLGHWYWN